MAGKWFRSITPRRAKSADLNTGVAHPARVYDYWLGGKDNFAADRETAEAVIAGSLARHARTATPGEPRLPRPRGALPGRRGRASRQFLDHRHRASRPSGNVHEVGPAGRARSARGRLRGQRPDRARARAGAAGQLATRVPPRYLRRRPARPGTTSSATGGRADPRLQPAGRASSWSAVLHLISDDEHRPGRSSAGCWPRTASGSYLLLTQPASDVDAQAVAAGAQQYNNRVTTPQTRRSREQVTRFFDGLDLVPPGVVQPHRWRPDPDGPAPAGESSNWAGVARKP